MPRGLFDGLDWVEWRIRRLSRKLEHFELSLDPDESSDDDAVLAAQLSGQQRRDGRFLRFYTAHGVEQALRTYGVWQILEARQFRPRVDIHNDDDRDRLRIIDARTGAILIELVARYARLIPRGDVEASMQGLPAPLRLLAIEWLMLQDPTQPFTPRRLPLPGQAYPGLGVGREIMAILEVMCERLGQQGLLNCPQFYHNGALYDRRFSYLLPQRQGELKALERDLSGLPLAEASWAIALGLVRVAGDGAVYKWHGSEMVWAADPALAAYFRSDSYREAVRRTAASIAFEIDRTRLRTALGELRRRLAAVNYRGPLQPNAIGLELVPEYLDA